MSKTTTFTLVVFCVVTFIGCGKQKLYHDSITFGVGDKLSPFASYDCQVMRSIDWETALISNKVEKNQIVFPSDGSGEIILHDGTRYTAPKGCTIRHFTIISGSLIVSKPK